MDVGTAMARRRSVRGYLPTPVKPALLERLAIDASRAASGGNLQPWHVDIVRGEAMAELKALMAAKLAAGETEPPGYDIYPQALTAPHRDRRFAIGEELYRHLGIARDDKAGRRQWFARNFRFFGAPAAYFVTIGRHMGPPQWADCGMFLQSLMLLAVEAGLATCAQEAWAVYPATIERFLATPPERMLFCGVAIGHEDPADPVNRARSERAPRAEWLTVRP